MGKPSDYWHGFASMDSGSERYKQIQHIISTGNFDYLKARALESRKKYQTKLPPLLECSIDLTHFTSGFDNVVLELMFSDHVYWVARIPHRVLDGSNRTSMLSEIATMRLVRRQTSIPLPHVFDFEATGNQPFGYPFILMECLEGRMLPDGVAKTVPKQYLDKVAYQLATVFSELQRLTFSRIGRIWCGEDAEQAVNIIPMAWHSSPGPLDTSFEYFYDQKQSENKETMAMHPDDPDWLTACWVLKGALTHMIVEDRVRGPFPLCHLDLHYGNMLFDAEYNLTGIIDWSNAQAAPLEQLSVCPEFVTFPGLSDEDNQPIVDLKSHFMASLKQIEAGQGRRLPIDCPQGNIASYEDLTRLSTYMASKSALITHRHYMASPRACLWAGRTVAKLIYGETVTWEQLKEVYGTLALF